MGKKTIAISIGDINGIGIQLALQNHKKISKWCKPIYCIDKKLLTQAVKLLDISVPKNFNIFGKYDNFKIKPSKVSKKSGKFSYESFLNAINLVKNGKADAVCTLPIHKKGWEKAGISYVGHTDMLRDIFKKDAIMMLGCDKMFVALYTEHIPLKDVTKYIQKDRMVDFLINFYKSTYFDKVAVLGVNPHAGDNGVLGNEEIIINKAIKQANKILQKDIFCGSVVPDVAFAPTFRKHNKYYIAIYHDQGLSPLKALYFDESINISLNLPIKRASVDHGTAFDIAYKNKAISSKSYINAIKYLVNH